MKKGDTCSAAKEIDRARQILTPSPPQHRRHHCCCDQEMKAFKAYATSGTLATRHPMDSIKKKKEAEEAD